MQSARQPRQGSRAGVEGGVGLVGAVIVMSFGLHSKSACKRFCKRL